MGLFRRKPHERPRLVPVRYSIGSNVPDDRMDMTIEHDTDPRQSEILTACYLHEGKAVFELSNHKGQVRLIDWEEFRVRTEDFFKNWAPEPDSPQSDD